MNKNEILHAYINRLPMGGNIYGVEAASRVYFALPSSDLNLAQATILAVLPNDPTDLNPAIAVCNGGRFENSFSPQWRQLFGVSKFATAEVGIEVSSFTRTACRVVDEWGKVSR